MTSRRWRSNLRRLQNLTAWHRQAASSAADAESAKATWLPILARKLKRKRCPSAGAGRGKACAVFPACRAARWPGKRARCGKKARAPKKARPAAASAETEEPQRREKKQAAKEVAKEEERSEKKAKKQAAVAEAAAEEEREQEEEERRKRKKAKKEAAAADAAKLAAAAEEGEAAEEERSKRKRAKKEAAAAEVARLAAAVEEEGAEEEERPKRKEAKREAAASEAATLAAAAEEQEEEEEEEEEQEEERPKKQKKAKKEAEAPAADDTPEPAAAEEEEANAPKPPKAERAAASRARPRVEGPSTLALALTAEDLKKRTGAKPAGTPRLPTAGIPSSGSAPEAGKAKLEPRQPANPPPAPPPRTKADVASEIPRILNAQSPEELLQVDHSAGEEAVTKAWKRLVLLLHPDKLHGLDEATRQAGQDALNFVHMAREELKRRTQEQCAEVPADPEAAGPPRLLEASSGARKYEISWRLPETQDPSRPVEKYEIWGPRYFSEAGDPFDPVLLATLPPLQSHFVLVEEAPTQQDVMWAADRVLRPSLPLTVHAANGKGSSGALTFELPWSSIFPWLQGTTSVLCPQCLRLNARRQNWTRCGGCGYNVPPEASIIVRCPECHGEALWNRAGELNCSCCMLRLGQAHDLHQQPQYKPWNQQKPPRGHVPPPNFAGSARGGRHY